MNNEIITDRADFDQIFTLAGRIANRINSHKPSAKRVQDAITNPNGNDPLYLAIDAIFEASKVEEKKVIKHENPLLQSWVDFYFKYFGLVIDLSGVKIPDKKEGFDRLIVVAAGMSINLIYDTGKKNFSSWKWCDDDLESKMRESERGTVKVPYAFWVRDNQEADEDLKNTSALMIEEQKIDTENLLERLLHGFKYWSENKQHLDVGTVTLCASSRSADGDVPRVARDYDGLVRVHRYVPQYRVAGLRARRAVR